MNSSKRVEWIDITKGIAIFLMVIGHSSLPIAGNKFIWSFHMPLFYIVSGMLLNKERYSKFEEFIKRCIFSLLIPYIFFTIIVTIINSIFDVGVIWSPKDGWGAYALWFVEVLFVSEIIIYLLIKSIHSKYLFALILVIMLTCGWLFQLYEISFPFKMHVVLWASFFYGLGYLFQNLLKKISVKYYVSFGMLLLAFIVCQFLPKTDMCFNNHGLFPLNTIVAIWSTTAIILISKTVSEHPYGHTKRILIWGGGNTYTIMGLSQIIMIVLKDIFIDFPIPY